MKRVLSPAGRSLLRAHLQRDPVLAFDFDGTLAPIVADPAAAEIPAATHARLVRLAAQHPCVVVSGRARSDVLARLRGVPVAEAVGNHGSEPWLDARVLRDWLAAVLPDLRARLAGFAGAELEDKGASVSVHYRRSFDRQAVIDATHRAARALGFEQIIAGKLVINLLPPGSLDKAQGLMRAMAELARSSALYVGDDVTDESVFVLPEASGVLGIRIGFRRHSGAALYLARQDEIDALLDLLLDSKGRS